MTNPLERSAETKSGEHWNFIIKQVFQAIDADNSGLITPDELREGFSRLGVTVSLEEARSLVRKCDRNNDGKVNYEGKAAIIDDATVQCLQHVYT